MLGAQRTRLAPRSPAKAGVAHPRKALGRIYGHAVRLGPPDAALPVGADIETVLPLVTAAAEITAEGGRAAERLRPGGPLLDR